MMSVYNFYVYILINLVNFYAYRIISVFLFLFFVEKMVRIFNGFVYLFLVVMSPLYLFFQLMRATVVYWLIKF